MTTTSPRKRDPLAARARQRDVDAPARLDPDGARGGERGERVAAHVGRGERQLERPPAASSTSPPGPNVTVAHVVAQVRRRAAARRPGRRPSPPGAQAGDQLGLRGGDRLDRAEQLEVHRADVDDHADVGLGDRGQLGDLAGAAHRHLEHEHLGAGRRAEDRQRQPDLGVEVLRGRDRRAGAVASIAARRSFVEVLPVEPVIAMTVRAELAAPGGRERAAARRAGRRRRAATPARRAARGVGVLGADERRPTRRPASACAREARRRRRCSPGRPTKRSPGPTSRESIVDARGPRRRRAGAGADEPRARRALRRRGSGDQARTQRLARDGDVVERDLARRPRTPGPARGPCRRSTTTSPSRGERDRALDRGAAVDARRATCPAADARRRSRR